MDINKIFAELGRMHLEVMQLQEQLAQARALAAATTPAPATSAPAALPEEKAA